VTQYPHCILDAIYQGAVTTADDGSQFFLWAHEKSKVIEGGKIKGLIMVT
jgi:hypothetical protein